ncbi:MAG TPA: NAD-dependent epimerase/dehydratase family protein [Mesorhizobium sp.]|jgi:UDP-glucose 4-epimerase|nr:NAD-dependent epimerase/dehydratase family protein [Mesorhizobium sp.]
MSDLVLVTGARGFIGSAVVRALKRDGFQVRAASREVRAAVPEADELVGWPAPDRRTAGARAALEGVTHVVHCAGDAEAHAGDEDALLAANAGLTAELVGAAAGAIPGKFVFLSSARAVCGPVSGTVVSDATAPRPQDAYGRSKLEAEQRLRNAFGAHPRWTILRPTPVYGPGARGQIGALLKLAALPLPLPLAGLKARRSLLSREACADAVLHALRTLQTDAGAFIVSDRDPVSVVEILTAFRRGLGRRPNLLPAPAPLLGAAAALLGQRENWRRLAGGLVADPSGLAATGWKPPSDTLERLEELARAGGGRADADGGARRQV